MKILIAEDEKDLRVLLNDQLSGAGHAVYHEKPDVVINEMKAFIDDLED